MAKMPGRLGWHSCRCCSTPEDKQAVKAKEKREVARLIQDELKIKSDR